MSKFIEDFNPPDKVIPNVIFPKIKMVRIPIGEKRKTGDFYYCKWKNELVQITRKIKFFDRKITAIHLPHYRISSNIIKYE